MAPGSRMASTSRSTAAGISPPRRREYEATAPLRRMSSHSGIRGSWKKYMYHDARPWRLVTNDLRNAAGCGTDTGDTVASRSGISAAAEMPERLATVSPVSVPHPAAFLKSFVTSRQGLASWYMYFFQLPRIPEWLLMRRNGAVASYSLRRGGLIPAA